MIRYLSKVWEDGWSQTLGAPLEAAKEAFEIFNLKPKFTKDIKS